MMNSQFFTYLHEFRGYAYKCHSRENRFSVSLLGLLSWFPWCTKELIKHKNKPFWFVILVLVPWNTTVLSDIPSGSWRLVTLVWCMPFRVLGNNLWLFQQCSFEPAPCTAVGGVDSPVTPGHIDPQILTQLSVSPSQILHHFR